jgi:DNA polymerase III epsilon subunit-like protein
MSTWVRVTDVLAFVERTKAHGVPERVALDRAAKRYGVQRSWLRQLMRSS